MLPLGLAVPLTASFGTTPEAYDFRIRTLTAGLQVGGKGWIDEAERAPAQSA